MSGDAAAPLVSVVINCYNSELYLKEAIDSVYAQNWPRWEIILWDNASTDRTPEIARNYDDRLRYFRAPQTTPLGEARNLAFQRALGDYIAMLDSDDVWLPHTLQRLVAGIEDGGIKHAVCYGGVLRIAANGAVIGQLLPPDRKGDLFDDFLRQLDIMPCASIVRRSVLVEEGHGFDSNLTTSEDVCFFLTLAARHSFRSLSEPVAKYRIHEGALTNRSIGRWADEWQYTIDKIRQTNPGLEDRYAAGMRHYLARVDYYRARNLIHLGERAAASRLLGRNVTVDFRYFVLFLISLMPRGVWDAVHRWYHKRSQFS